MKIITSITGVVKPDQRLGFSVWARGSPKSYLSEYPELAKALAVNQKFESLKIVALIDDVLPMITLGRNLIEQEKVSKEYTDKMPTFGFDSVHLVSDFVSHDLLWEYLKFATGFTGTEFMKLLPKSKQEQGELGLSEIVSFLWHIHVMEIAIDRFQLTGFLAGIRSQFFYLAARKVLTPHDVYFLGT